MESERISLEELYYLLMSSWIYSIEKTRKELLGPNIAYTKRIGWNATEYITEQLKAKCDIKAEGETPLDSLKSIIKCLEDVDFIKKGTVNIKQENDVILIEITGCGAEACKKLVSKGIMPQVCLRSIIFSTLLEKTREKEYAYQLEADPEGQPPGRCITSLSETIE
ncbi:MAG: hypothetical protein FJ150_06150 [Euryarchaeota archaeon]|nr:hypothetical protein [Euryarchaeota archaeon]